MYYFRPKKSEHKPSKLIVCFYIYAGLFGRIISVVCNSTLRNPHAQFLENVGKTDRN